MNTAQRKEYLAALGLTTWVVRVPAAPAPIPPPAMAAATAGESMPAVAPVLAEAPASRTISVTPVSSVPPLVRPVPLPRPVASARSGPPTPQTGADAEIDREAGYDWAQLRERVAACTRCGLSTTRTQTVFGVGNPQAEWLVVGEAPGAEEDRQGEPFVGRAGQLLNSMLRAIGLAREQVYIANVLKCRPPGNRDPSPGEAAECLPYLEQQIALLKPKIMLAVGRIASQNLLRTDATLGRLRQQVHRFGLSQVPLVVTYHPAYLLRTPTDKRKAWEDLKFAREVCARV